MDPVVWDAILRLMTWVLFFLVVGWLTLLLFDE